MIVVDGSANVQVSRRRRARPGSRILDALTVLLADLAGDGWSANRTDTADRPVPEDDLHSQLIQWNWADFPTIAR